MTPPTPPRRSVLYVPGSNARALAKAHTLAADAFIFDLEDAVAPDAKATARTNVALALAEADFGGRERVVRVNGLSTPWGLADLRSLAALPSGLVDAVALPKVESPMEVAAVRRVLAAEMPLWCMVETPRGVLAAAEIARAGGVTARVAGTSDLSKDLRVRPHPERLPLLHALSHLVLAARAAGVAVLDGVCLDLDDDAAFERESLQGVALGFDGKTLIHPKTIAAANRLFGPSPEELASAARVVEAGERALAAGLGVVVVDGRLVENLHVEAARRLLAQAAAIAAAGRG